MPKIKVGICPGATQSLLQTLNANGILSVSDFISSDLETLSVKCSLPYQDLTSIRRVLLAQYSAFPVTGTDLYTHRLANVSILSTGCKSVDQLLDGGIYTGELTEIAGDVSSGKTQMCFTTAALVAMEKEQYILYIDTCGSFTAERIEEILQERNCKTISSALQRVKYHQAFDVFSLLEILEDTKYQLTRKLDSFYNFLRLIIVDNVTSVISPVLGGQQSDGHALMSHVAQKLRMISREFSCAVLVTNSLTSSGTGTPTVSLGRTWLHTPHTRIVFQHNKPPTTRLSRRAVLTKSPRMGVFSSCDFKISERGCEDVT